MTGALCRDCAGRTDAGAPAGGRCPACGSPRLLAHPELDTLAIAHVDCDAFYASIEKRDDPALEARPVVVGGGRRGVVAAACYVARLHGVRSAMPMYEALRRCPDAVVIPPDMAKYRRVGHEIRRMMREATPLVEPLSIDEAFLDLSGADRGRDGSPAEILVRLVRRIETEVGVTASVGLSYNKFLAKIASDRDKPRGFSVIGREEAVALLAPMPVGVLWGVGRALRARLAAAGITRVGQLAERDEAELVGRFGAIGRRLARFARGEDDRPVNPDAPTRSVSAETTFERDIRDADALKRRLRPLCETVAGRLERGGFGGRTVTLKLRASDFRIRTRRRTLAHPTRAAEVIYRTAEPLLEREADGTAFRLIGVGMSALEPAERADPPDLLDPVARDRGGERG